MNRPLLQVALDQTKLEDALNVVKNVKDHVDIIEAGTILCLSEGSRSIGEIRKLVPDHIIAADYKTADAGSTLAALAFDWGADWFTVICGAPMATIEVAQEVAVAKGKEVQIELFGNWTYDEAKEWVKMGVKQAIYHRGRDAQASGQIWGEKDLAALKTLSDIGLELSITGGLVPEELAVFKDVNAKAFIAGRALANMETGVATAQKFQNAITEFWGE